MRRSIFTKGFFLAGILAGLFFSNIRAQDLESALRLTKSEQYDKAREMLQQLIQKEPSNAKNFYYLGENFLLDYYADTISNSFSLATNTAKEAFQKGVNANPNDPLNYIGLAKVAVYQGDDKTAAEMRTKAKSFLLPYKNLKKISPPAKDYAFALAKIAETYIKEKEVDTASALPLIRQAVKIDSKNPEIYLIAGDIYILANDGSNAIKNYNLAQFADPKSPTANMKIGSIYVRGKSLNAAIPYFEEAISLDPNYAPAYRELGQLYWMAQRLEQSKSNYKKYLELNEGNIPAQTRYVNALFYAGDYDEVIRNVEEILAVDKSRAYMNRLAGYSSFEKKNADYDKALSYMEELFKALPADRILWKDHHYMARILMRKNQNFTKLADELASLQGQLEKEQSKYASAPAATKPKLKPALDELTAKVEEAKLKVDKANQEIDRGFSEYEKVLEMKPQDKGLLSEMASNYYNFKRYDKAAKTWAMLIDPANEKVEDFMQIGRAYYIGEKYKSADSVFNLVIQKDPNYLPAYTYIARTYSRMDPDSKMGLAKPKFEKLLDVAKSDSLKNEDSMIEALKYLGYYYMSKDDYNTSRNYYNRLINLNPSNKENKIAGYNGIGLIELRLAGAEKVNEARLPFLSRSAAAYEQILALDPNNASAKNQINYIREFEASVRKGINPNEIKGVIRDAVSKQPIAYASIRVKDTAAEMMSNTRGEFKFEIPQGSEFLLISAKGYSTKEVPITKSRVYNVSLEK
ncbi:MAG TPA: tetratricopeptide repeat protein [Bacteroidales bacterium]|jgi:tetratricopeptide (TPR) repeat protein|nr:tetratricopeptide repeat protein [Bacteroidales bacterium]HOX76058.1 tetratricopeptide repeat protein [Bacteroidales bacterium]HQM68896.1 tetratricopeptide repeat protein [Bacteroidales bacterium]